MAGLLNQAPEQAQPPQAPQAEQASAGMNPTQALAEQLGVPATEEEQAAYEQALSLVSRLIHGEDATHAAIMKMLDPREKIGSVAKAAVAVLSEIDGQMDIAEQVLIGVLTQTVDWLMELATVGRGMKFSEKEEAQVLATATELLLEVYGVDEDDYATLTEGLSNQDMSDFHDQYKGLADE